MKPNNIKEISNFYNYDAVFSLLLDIPDNKKRALFCLLYVTGTRVNELTKIKREDMHLETINGKKILVITCFTEKNKKSKFREVPIPYEIESSLCNVFLNYPSINKQPLFPFHRATIFKWCKKYLGFHPHWLRHLRATHLTSVYNFSDNKLECFFGWSDSRPAKIYRHLQYQELAKSF